MRDGPSVFVSEVDAANVQDALKRKQGAVEIRELSGNRMILNVENVVRVEFHA